MQPSNESGSIDHARLGGDATVYVAPCADTGRAEITIDGGTAYIVIIDGDNAKVAEVTLSFKADCPWALADATRAFGMACRHAGLHVEQLAKVLKDTYKDRYPFYNGNRAARRAGGYFFEHTDEPRRRWPVLPRYMVCKGRRKYK